MLKGMTLPEALETVRRLTARVQELEKRIAQLIEENARWQAAVQERDQKIRRLEQEVARQAAPFRRTDEQKVPLAEHKKPGRPAGHRGQARARPPQIDHEIDVPLTACPHCQGPLTGRLPRTQIIEEIPPLRPTVTRLTTWQAVCPHCGPVSTTHPLQTSLAQGAAGTMLGPRAQALAALLNKHLGLTMSRTCQVLKQLCGLSLSRGGLAQLVARLGDRSRERYEQLIEQLRSADVVYADETSWWVGGPGWWLWTFTNPTTTVYRVEPQRSSDVVSETLGAYAGTLVSDCLVAYDRIACKKHKCIAHHLRAIRHARDRPDTQDPRYLDAWKTWMQAVSFLARHRALFAPEDYAQKVTHLRGQCAALLAEVRTQPGDVAVQKRLLKQREHLMGCLESPGVEATNNRAERSLRPAVIARKLSCGNKTARGKRAFETLKSLFVTAEQRLGDFVQDLTTQLALSTPAR